MSKIVKLSYIIITIFYSFNSSAKDIFKVDGHVNFSASLKNQSSVFEQNNYSNNLGKNSLNNSYRLTQDSQIFFKAGRKVENDLYGGVAKVEYNINSDDNNQDPSLDKAYIFAKSDFGRVEFGNKEAVNQQMKSGPTTFARGAGGINGKYLENINLPISNSSNSNVKLPRFILLAQSPIGHGGYAKSFYRNSVSQTQNDNAIFAQSNFRSIKDDSFDGLEDALKINYFSPRINGFKLGVSYTRDVQDNGITSTKNFNYDDDVAIKNIFSFAINYNKFFNNLEVDSSFTFEKGNVENSASLSGVPRQDLSAYDFGATFGYFGFKVGGSFGSWQDSLMAKSGIYSCDYDKNQSLNSQNCANKSNEFNNPYYYTFGISYEIGPFGTSITTLNSNFYNNHYSAISYGIDYKLRKDLMSYLELTKFDFDSNKIETSDISNQIQDNSGYVLLTGILFTF